MPCGMNGDVGAGSVVPDSGSGVGDVLRRLLVWPEKSVARRDRAWGRRAVDGNSVVGPMTSALVQPVHL